MAKIMIWFYLSWKRYLKKLPFLLILLMLPIGSAAAARAMNSKDSGIRIAVCVLDSEQNTLGTSLVNHLVQRERGDNLFEFYQVPREQDVIDEVASRRAECGYVIYEAFEEKLEQKNMKRCIGVYSAPSTVLASLSSETVMSSLMELYDKELLKQYVAQTPVFDSLGLPGDPFREEAVEKSGSLYDKWLNSGSTFRFAYETSGQSAAKTGSDSSAAESTTLFPIRGVVAVFIFITGLYGAAVLCTDEEHGLFLPLSYHLRTPCRIASLAGPVTLSGIFGLLALWAGQCLQPFYLELAAMLFYIIVVTSVSWILRLICRRAGTICCLIPFFIIGSLLFCPVFVDAGRILPAIDTAAKFFPPYYYLRLFF